MKKPISIKVSFFLTMAIPAVFLVLGLVTSLTFGMIYVKEAQNIYLILSTSLALFFLVLFVVSAFICYKQDKKIYYDGIYKTTVNNLDALTSSKTKIRNYPASYIHEIQLLNNKIDSIRNIIDNSTLVSSITDFSGLSFEYDDEFKDAVTYESFKHNIRNIILISSSFRNVLLDFYFDIGNERLSRHELNNIIKTLREVFADYRSTLTILDKNKCEVMFYIPVIDSFTRLEEQIGIVLQAISITKKTSEGLITLPAKCAAVAYPYSDATEIFEDLKYAKDSTDKVINFYLPDRVILSNEDMIKNFSTNINNISKIVESLGQLEVNATKREENRNAVHNALKSIASYLSIDEVGIINLDDDSNDFICLTNATNKEKQIFKVGSTVDPELIKIFGKYVDSNRSYYFSSRRKACVDVGREIDKLGVQSGYYYVVKDSRGINTVVYFFNYAKELIIDSFIRESLNLLSSRIGEYILNIKRDLRIVHAFNDLDDILRLTKYQTYRIDKRTYEVLSYTGGIKDIFPNVTTHKPCYEVLYGLDKPCSYCPLSRSKKHLVEINNYKYELSLGLNSNPKNRAARILITNVPNSTDHTSDRYNSDLLVYSYQALINDLSDTYRSYSKGYLLVLRIDNLDEIIDQVGSENTLIAIRSLAKRIKKSNGYIQNIYEFNSQSLGILYQEYGQGDVINKCEKIYEIAQENHFTEEQPVRFKLTYLPLAYPSGYATSIDFLKNAQKFFNSDKYEVNKDFIYFDESSYCRSASRKDFMLSVIDDKFSAQTFNALLQPYVYAKDRRVYGAEMLLRLSDDYRNLVFDATELIRVAAENGKISMISDAMLNYAGNLYKKEGSGIFKIFGMKRISINTDYSYFKDTESLSHLISLIKELNFPKEFIAFEIAETDVMNHYEEFKKVTNVLQKQHIGLICDQYSGRFVGIDKIKDMGFSEIKIGRGMIRGIDSDPKRRQLVINLMNSAKELGLKVSCVGVENASQYEILSGTDPDALLQGFYFFKPLKKSELINTLRSANASFNKK